MILLFVAAALDLLHPDLLVDGVHEFGLRSRQENHVSNIVRRKLLGANVEHLAHIMRLEKCIICDMAESSCQLLIPNNCLRAR